MIDKIKFYLELGIDRFTIDKYNFKITNTDTSSYIPLYSVTNKMNEDVRVFLWNLRPKYNYIIAVENDR